MIKSMTGFARHGLEVAGQALTWEIRSVNHRFLDLRLQLPDSLRDLEGELRARIQQGISRGKVEAQLRVETSAAAAAIRFDSSQAQALLRAVSEIDHLMVNGARVSPLEVLAWPGVLLRDPGPEPEQLAPAVFGALDAALDDLRQMREAEGRSLAALLEARLADFSRLVAEVRMRRPQVLAEQRDRLRARIADLDLGQDPLRLEQEIALVAQRLDVDEELDRLDGHIAAMREILGRDEPVGRRLDFLMQEFNRESNTLGSKSHDLATTRAAMDMKVLTEQMREQIQNLE
jgi:uncharacterized protein (TIGR00255 family)